MRKVAIIYARFGPYHIARLRGAQKVLQPREWDVFGLEICPDDQHYAWSKVSYSTDTRRVALFNGLHYRQLSRAQIRRAVLDALDLETPDVVVCPGWYYAEALAAATWAGRHGKIAVLMSETGAIDDPRIWWKELLKRRKLNQFHAALVGGKAHAEYLAQLGFPEDRIAFGHNVVDNEHFTNGANAARARADDFRLRNHLPNRYFLASGRFITKKNFGRWLEAYQKYLQVQCEQAWPLVLCGDGPLRDELQAKARALNISDHILWPGFIQYEDLPTYYGLAEAFVLPSTSEPWGLVVNEAMACGLPILGSNLAGSVRDLLDDDVNGLRFDPFDVNDIARAMIKFASCTTDQRIAMSKASESKISALGPDAFGKGLLQAIQFVQNNSAIHMAKNLYRHSAIQPET